MNLIESTSRSSLMHVQIVCSLCEVTCIVSLWLGLWHIDRNVLYCYMYILLCFCIDIGKVRGLFLVAGKSCSAWQKNNHDGFIVLLYFNSNQPASASGTNISTAFYHCPSKLM